MKKLLIVAAMATAFAGVNAQAASDGRIDFTGELIANTCDVSVEGGTENATIPLPAVSTSNLTTAGQTAGETQFAMDLTNCEGDATQVAAYFTHGDTVNTDGRLTNQTTDGATNVTLELLDYSNNTTGSVINVGNASQTTAAKYAKIDTGKAALLYAVRYYATGVSTAGAVTSHVYYNLQYK